MLLAHCVLCPHLCGVDRLAGMKGRCRAGSTATVFRFGPHFGEEPPISGHRGSGTIFFSSCPLRCVYCQNHLWSQVDPPVGREYSVDDLAAICLDLQGQGCHNINLVTPEPWIPHIVAAVRLAKARGFCLPVVYNTSGFITEQSLRFLRDTVDIYLTDLRYANPAEAREFSGSAGYFEAHRRAARLMWEVAGPLKLGPDGTAIAGVIIRHLLLPGLLDATASTLAYIAHEISPDVPVSLMGQFEPVHQARHHPPIADHVPLGQYIQAMRIARRLGLTKGWRQRPGPVSPGLLGIAMQPTETRL
ncbi:radical SAM protein [Candidatus Fermentibacteria bacterium]|nr:radical SAM protein [Candidatus Fermentibacteria bacterium]